MVAFGNDIIDVAFDCRLKTFELLCSSTLYVNLNLLFAILLVSLKRAIDASWCKGGRDRIIPILTEAQREALNEMKVLSYGKSLISADLNQLQAELSLLMDFPASPEARVWAINSIGYKGSVGD